ncbi:DnaD family protein [Spiroplasma diminutum]|uniref:Putative dnad-like replication protein n=1 Tax=Spiroplasma diminutum CUAS-1 TaxID=1276221 RepID=S5LZE7_9MOLU|nr:DnaD family protein [Spiroplasma diminutum]AGR41961.1 putative dnad-like replication protein [Spiroplasma diminutum CUAS-1]
MFELFKSGLISKKALLILNYSKIKINENQLAIILIIMELSNDDQKNFTPSQISEHMMISKEEIEKEIADLLKNRIIKLEQKGKKTILNLTPLFNRLLVDFEERHSNLGQDNNYTFVEKIFNYKLNAEEIEKIENYIELGISKPKIMSLIDEYKINNITELLKKLEENSKKSSVKITMYNWLND